MKPETSEALLELAERMVDLTFVTEYDPPWNLSECEQIAKGLREMLDERRGAEAEELRAGLEKIMADAPGGDLDSNHEWNAALQGLLDEVDARDSLSHLEQRELRKTRRREALRTVLNPAHMGKVQSWHESIDQILVALEKL